MNRKVFLLIFLAAFILGGMDAMNWPSEDAVLFKNFGNNDNGAPVLGMIFDRGTNVLAAEKGEVIFSKRGNDTASRLPSPLGAWTAIDHEDGLISIYSRHANTSASLTRVEKSQAIAIPGTTGWSERPGFYFIVFDRRERNWINPAMIITPVNRDGVRQAPRPPQIISVDFKDTRGVVTQSRNLVQGRYTVLVNALTPASSPALMRIICSVNGAEAGSLNFESFSSRDGVLMVSRNGLIPAKQVYSAYPAFEAAEVFLTRGQVNLEIIARDIAGNANSLVTRLIVN